MNAAISWIMGFLFVNYIFVFYCLYRQRRTVIQLDTALSNIVLKYESEITYVADQRIMGKVYGWKNVGDYLPYLSFDLKPLMTGKGKLDCFHLKRIHAYCKEIGLSSKDLYFMFAWVDNQFYFTRWLIDGQYGGVAIAKLRPIITAYAFVHKRDTHGDLLIDLEDKESDDFKLMLSLAVELVIHCSPVRVDKDTFYNQHAKDDHNDFPDFLTSRALRNYYRHAITAYHYFIKNNAMLSPRVLLSSAFFEKQSLKGKFDASDAKFNETDLLAACITAWALKTGNVIPSSFFTSNVLAIQVLNIVYEPRQKLQVINND